MNQLTPRKENHEQIKIIHSKASICQWLFCRLADDPGSNVIVGCSAMTHTNPEHPCPYYNDDCPKCGARINREQGPADSSINKKDKENSGNPEHPKTFEEQVDLDDLFDDIRQTCGDCEHPRCLSITKSAKVAILHAHREATEIVILEWRIEQWRRAKKYMLNDTWQPIFDELCSELEQLRHSTNHIQEGEHCEKDSNTI